MNAIATHFRIRLRAALTEPLTAVLLLLSGMSTLLIWPGQSDPSGAGWVTADETRLYAVLQIVLIWLVLWPMLVSRTSGRMMGQQHHLTVMPTLPIGLQARAFSEALVVLVAVLIMRFVGVFLVDWICVAFSLPRQPIANGTFWLEFLNHSLLGVVIMLPLLIACASPAQNVGIYWIRPLFWGGLLLLALKLGLFTTVTGCIVVSLVLTAVALALVSRELPSPSLGKRSAPSPATRRRPPRDPERQLRHDLWSRPIEYVWPLLLAAVLFQAAVVLVDYYFELPRLSFYLGTTLSASLLFGLLVLRPLGSVQATASFKGAPGYRHGDMVAAWSVMPVRREAVLRGVFLHGIITGALVWTLVVAANFWANWLATGTICLIDTDGDPVGWIIWPEYLAVPCVAAFLVAGAVGNVPLAFLSFICAIAILPVRVVQHEMGASFAGAAVFLLLMAIVGSAPALIYLRKPRPRREERSAARGEATSQPSAP